MEDYQSYVTAAFAYLVLIPIAFILAAEVLGRVLQFGIVELPHSDRDTWAVRVLQRRELRKSRLGQLMTALGIDLDQYRKAVPVSQVRGQLDACRRCPSKRDCDRTLASRHASLQAVAYCPNASWLAWIKAQPGDAPAR